MPGLQMASVVSISAGSPGGSCCLVQSSGLFSCAFSVPVPFPSPVPASISLRRGKGFSSKQSLFWSRCPDHRDLLRLLPDSQLLKDVPVKFLPSRIVSSRKRSSAADLATLSDGRAVQKSRKAGWDGQKALLVTEGVCIVVAGASYSMSVLNKQQTTVSASSSAASERSILPRLSDPSTWCVPALWVALVINAMLRTWQRRPSPRWDERNIKDFTLDQRVGKLEEDVKGMTTTTRMLSRHLEKLGVRFRATKRNLRDPVQETIELVKRTSAVVRELASREEVLERELRETQQGLIAVQEQQMKQLELLKAGMAKNLKSQQAAEARIMKALYKQPGQHPRSPAEQARPLKPSNGEASPEKPKPGLMGDIMNLWRSKFSNESNTSSYTSSKDKSASLESNQANSSKDKRPFDVQSGHSVMASAGVESETSGYSPDTRFRDEDFWATPSSSPPPTSESANGSSAEEVLDVKGAGVQSPHQKVNSDRKVTSGKLDSFFNSKKDSNSSQDGALPVSKSTENLNVRQSSSQSGERNSNGNTPH